MSERQMKDKTCMSAVQILKSWAVVCTVWKSIPAAFGILSIVNRNGLANFPNFSIVLEIIIDHDALSENQPLPPPQPSPPPIPTKKRQYIWSTPIHTRGNRREILITLQYLVARRTCTFHWCLRTAIYRFSAVTAVLFPFFYREYNSPRINICIYWFLWNWRAYYFSGAPDSISRSKVEYEYIKRCR